MSEYYVTGAGERIYKDPAKQRAYLEWKRKKALEAEQAKALPKMTMQQPARQMSQRPAADDGYDIIDGERIYHDPAKQARWMKFLKEKEAEKAVNERNEFEEAYQEDQPEYELNMYGDRVYYDTEKGEEYSRLIKKQAIENIERPKENPIFASEYNNLNAQFEWEEKHIDMNNFEMQVGDYDLGDKNASVAKQG